MKYLNKKIIYTIIIIIIILVSFVLAINYFKQNEGTQEPSNNNGEPSGEEPNLSNRDIAIKEALENPDKFQKIEFKNNIYFITRYDEEKFTEKNQNTRPAGFIFFKLEEGKPVLFWESKELLSNSGFGEFSDIDSDGIKEFIWLESGATGRGAAFYIYRFSSDGFELITPTEHRITYNITLIGGDAHLTYMEDIDNDGIQEIRVGYEDKDGNKQFEIYKYDGEQYYLWKEEKIGEEKPEL